MQDIQLDKDGVNLTLRMSLFDSAWDNTAKELENLQCGYFEHQFIANHERQGHTVSSFHSKPDWQTEYWEHYWDNDPLDRKVHQLAEAEGFVISSWGCIPENDVMKRRKLVCDVYDGVQFAFKHKDGVLENYSFGWTKDGRGKVGFDKLLKLSDIVSSFRDAHLKLFSEPTRHSSDER